MAPSSTNQINLAPKASHEEEDDDDFVDADIVTNLNLVHSSSMEDGRLPSLISGGSGGSPTNRMSNNEAAGVGNRARTNSHGSYGGGNPGGSADTRRRITKLSKAREREKVPRLVEYFCVVSSVAVAVAVGGGNDNNNNNNNNNDGTNGSVGATAMPGSPPRAKSVTNIQPIPHTPGAPGFPTNYDTDTDDDEEGEKANRDTHSNTRSTANMAIDGSEFQPEITARYPLQDHEENPLLPESITAFCFPSGKIPIKVSDENASDGGGYNGPPMPKVHYFVTTGERGQSMYGTCLTIWEGHVVTVQVRNETIKSNNNTNNNGNNTTTTKSNVNDGKNGREKSKAERAMEAPVYNKHDFMTTPPSKIANNDKSTEKSNNYNVTTTTKKQIVYLPKCLVILSMHPYLIAFREYLTQLHRLSKNSPPIPNNANETSDNSNNNIMNAPTEIILNSSSHTSKTVLTLPIERYITNFCSELPAPPPGSFQVQTTILDSVISIWSPPHNMPIAWVSLPFSHLFQCLDVQNVLLVWTALALERQVLVTSTQLSLLTTCCEILLSLLFPMKWSHAYIPVLPHFLVPILSAPMPFLCGIDKRHLADTLEDLSMECIVVDLDKNQVSLGVKTPPLPSLPKYIYERLKNKVEVNAGGVHREVRSLRKEDNTSEMGFYLPPEVKSMADAMWESRLCLFDEAFILTFTPEERRKNWLNGDDGSGIIGTSNDATEARIMTLSEKQNLRYQSQWDAVQEAFLETYCFLLHKYRKFLVFPSKQNEGAYGGAGFRSQEFLANQRSDVRDFLEEVVGSQMFDDFVTKRLYGSGEADISFFDTAVDKYVKNQSLIANVSASIGRNVGGGGGGNAGGGAGRGDGAATGAGARIRNFFGGGPSPSNAAAKANNGEKDQPLLQSARAKHTLKTIVPPEPCGADLPERTVGNATVVRVLPKSDDVVEEEYTGVDEDDDYRSGDSFPRAIASTSDAASVTSTSTTASKANKTSKGRVYYHYPTFPERLDPELFGTPRPMSSAVMAEYDRQRENAGKFRRMSSKDGDGAGSVASQNARRNATITGQLGPAEKPATSEVTTFSVFFMTFTAVVGKDLMDMSNDSLSQMDDQTILSTCKDHKQEKRDDSEKIANLVDAIVMDADLPASPSRVQKTSTPKKTPVRHRFNDKLSTLKIMEAKETSKAELGIAFEMLKMMKERGLSADPEAYQCLIDACGRCGDTDRATQLLSRMHEDGIVADGVVYSSLVAAFSAENAWKQASGDVREELPEWANGAASMDMDWNTLKVHRRSYIDIVKDKFGATDEIEQGEGHPAGLRNTFKRMISRQNANQAAKKGMVQENTYTEQFVTDQVLRQILLGENLLEIVYPDITIDTDNEFCPRCNFYLSDDDVVTGWTAGNSQEYKTQCPNCLTKFVPHFCVQSTLPSFVGSRGPASALFCERLSPWVLKKELRSVISGGIEDLLSPEWREKESKNAVLWWNLILSFMRYRFPFTFLLQGSFGTSLIAPTPDDGDTELAP